jgi:glutathione peroxidase
LLKNETNTIYQFKMKSIEGKEISLADYQNKVVLIVNVASECGYTPQYERIEQLYEKYKSKGFVVLGFPANNFMGQEPGTDAEIKTFCTSKYGVTFPIFSKISVKGDDMHPLYHFLTEKSLNGVSDFNVKWNFSKFIIGKDGKVVTNFPSKINVTDDSFLKTLETELAK